ncbi:MAG: hypothetical protein ACUZ9M_08160, partial [Candidatus Scalindua sp.]
NTAIQQMDQITQQNAANAEETASASEEMSAQTENLMDQIGVLAALVGGTTGSGVSGAGEKKAIRDTSAQSSSGVKSTKQSYTAVSGSKGGRAKKAPHKAELEALIPMGENRIVEHDEKMSDF